MRCIMCKGSTVQMKHTYIQEFENCIIIIKNVPALVCSQCGEVYYSDDIAEKLAGSENDTEIPELEGE